MLICLCCWLVRSFAFYRLCYPVSFYHCRLWRKFARLGLLQSVYYSIECSGMACCVYPFASFVALVWCFAGAPHPAYCILACVHHIVSRCLSPLICTCERTVPSIRQATTVKHTSLKHETIANKHSRIKHFTLRIAYTISKHCTVHHKRIKQTPSPAHCDT